jgi:hypothetical protein
MSAGEELFELSFACTVPERGIGVGLRHDEAQRSIECLGFGPRSEHLPSLVELSLVEAEMFVSNRCRGCHDTLACTSCQQSCTPDRVARVLNDARVGLRLAPLGGPPVDIRPAKCAAPSRESSPVTRQSSPGSCRHRVEMVQLRAVCCPKMTVEKLSSSIASSFNAIQQRSTSRCGPRGPERTEIEAKLTIRLFGLLSLRSRFESCRARTNSLCELVATGCPREAGRDERDAYQGPKNRPLITALTPAVLTIRTVTWP